MHATFTEKQESWKEWERDMWKNRLNVNITVKPYTLLFLTVSAYYTQTIIRKNTSYS